MQHSLLLVLVIRGPWLNVWLPVTLLPQASTCLFQPADWRRAMLPPVNPSASLMAVLQACLAGEMSW